MLSYVGYKFGLSVINALNMWCSGKLSDYQKVS